MLHQIRNIIIHTYILWATLLFILLLTYINILPNKLFFDDEELIYKNVFVQDLSYIPKYFTSNMIAGAGKISNMYRPILTLSFAVDYLLWKDNPIGYHLTSIFLHGANTILIFLLIQTLFTNKFISFISSLLFIVHPVQTEAIAYASGRTDLLYAFFLLLSLIFFHSSRKGNKFYIYKYSFSLFLFILSLLSKETAIILPFLVILITLLKSSEIKQTISQLLFLTFPFFLIAIFYILFRLTILNFGNTLNFYSNISLNEQTISYSSNIAVRIQTFTKVFFDYLGILFFPKDLIMIRNAEIITSFFNPWVIAFGLITIVSGILSIKTWGKQKIFFFSFLWFYLILLPVSGIIPINNIVAEHYLYLPSVSFFLLIAFLLDLLLKKFNYIEIQSVISVFTVCVICILMIRTIIRTFDWRDPITFYTISLKQSPWHIPMRNNLAMAYEETGKPHLAIREYKQILALADVYPNIHHNMANAYKKSGEYKMAEEEYYNALKMDPNFLFSYYGLYDLYNKTGEKNKQEEIKKKFHFKI